jgi:glycosyltransferase involved in cell wall biosynthesis
MPLVSIVIPAFNAGSFIGRALEAVRQQTHAEWEVIVIEDGSHDETEEIVARFASVVPQAVLYKNNGINRGIAATRNVGLILAAGTMIAFLDADDWWMPNHLETGVNTLARGAGLCFSGCQIYDQATQTVMASDITTTEPSEPSKLLLFAGNFIQTASLVMIRREIRDAVGQFDSRFQLSEDWDYWMRTVAAEFTLMPTGQPTCFYVKHGASAMTKTLAVAEDAVTFYAKYLDNCAIAKAARHKFYARSIWIFARLLHRHNLARAASLFTLAWRCRPLDFRYAAYALFFNVISLLFPRRNTTSQVNC